MKDYLGLFAVFFKLGCITFGGGYAMLPVLERELIRKRNWTTMDEVMDYYTIAQVTPGLIGINVSTFIGFKRKGIIGGILTTLGFIAPGAVLMLLAALGLKNFAGIPAVQHAFAGIRIAVGALIVDTVIKLCKGVFKDAGAVIVFTIALILSAAFGFSPVPIIIGAGIMGFFAYRRKKTPPSNEKIDTGNPPPDEKTVPPEGTPQ